MTDLPALAEARSSAGGLPGWATAVAGAALLGVGVAGTLWVSHHLEADATLHEAALFGHLASLVVGFGAVLTVDWVGLLWLLGRRDLEDVLAAARTVHLPIWAGYTGLVLTGMLLSPDLTSWLTWTKLVLVVVIGWNGLVAAALVAALSVAAGPVGTARRLTRVAGLAAAVSQAGWWGAMVIGFLNAR